MLHPSPRLTLPRGLAARLSGPGGLYNNGNALGLAGGLALAIATAGPRDGGTLATGLAAARDHLAGNAAAILITLAMLVFFWGGEVYHRAWANGAPPDPALNRQGDLLSALGALLLGAGLLLTGQALLAATAGLLHAAGKLGSALGHRGPARPSTRPDLARVTVLASRLPALVLVIADLARVMAAPGPAPALALAAPLLLLTCYLIWARADILLFRSA